MKPDTGKALAGMFYLFVCVCGLLSPVAWLFTAFWLMHERNGEWYAVPVWVLAVLAEIALMIIAGMCAAMIVMGVKQGIKKPSHKPPAWNN